jgi:hypothetical protein
MPLRSNTERLARMGLIAPQRAAELLGGSPAMHGDRDGPSPDELRRQLDDVDSQSPDGIRSRARADRDAAVARIADDERRALEGVTGAGDQAAIRAIYTDRRDAAERQLRIAEANAQRREGAISRGRSTATQALARGPGDVRGGGMGAIGRERERRRREVEQWRKVNMAVPDPDRALITEEAGRRLREIDRWADGPEGEAWAQQQYDAGRQHRDAASASSRAERRVGIMDQLAEIETQQNGNGTG